MDSVFDSVTSQIIRSHKVYQELEQKCKTPKYPIAVQGVHGGLLPLLAHKISQKLAKPILLVFATEKEAELFCHDIESLGGDCKLFNNFGALPYRPLAHNAPVFGKRVQVLASLLRGRGSLYATSVRAYASCIPDPTTFESKLKVLKKGNTFDPTKLADELTKMGYLRVPRVSVPGEFVVRGEVVDVYQPGEELATRIVFEFDTISEIRDFDPLSQTSMGKESEVVIHPLREVVWDDDFGKRIVKAIETLPEFKVKDQASIDDITLRALDGSLPCPEAWFPLGHDQKFTIHDWLPLGSVTWFVDYERLYSAAEAMAREYYASYRKSRIDIGLMPRPERLICHLSERQSQVNNLVIFPLLQARSEQVPVDEDFDADTASSPSQDMAEGDFESIQAPSYADFQKLHFNGESPRSFFGNIQFLKEELASYQRSNTKVLVCAEGPQQKQRLEVLLADTKAVVVEQQLQAGFALLDSKLVVIQENEIFGRKRKVPASLKKVQSQAIDSFVELEPGDHVVHIHHGIGKFLGIKRIVAANTERDYIELEYASQEFVFVPIEQVNLVQRYIGSQGDSPRLDTLGGKAWESRKTRVRKSVEDLAEHLLQVYSKRKKAKGFAFPKDGEWQIQFEASFPYEETEDQIRCIAEVKADMELDRPMDRMVCGDVGFGKTEIALRAAFKAVTAGKQVAILAPTTILAEQHYESLLERLQGFPIRLGMLSRFVAPKEQKRVIDGLKDGTIDLVIGTHRMIQKDVVFKDLGLMVIDEEQRFGVKDKERLKELKASIDALTLTATPIPRTLHMSLLKIRDMSVLQTPPYNRKPIETYVQGFNEHVVTQAIRREIARGGQVFYLHNRVESLETVQAFIQNLMPEVLVETAHGRMSATELEDIMHRFIHGGFQVLIATTIVENGINIPNVNTIIIDRADMYGISQLYQLRGRVGRSGRLAYAYLLYPGEKSLSELAMKRLQIISDHTELGSGFKIALKDLEVRGAGNLLGAEQSGEIVSVGFDLYLRLLDEAVRKLSAEGHDEYSEVNLDLEYSGFIPETYVSEPMAKMEVYKKIASITTREELEAVHAEIIDRFGPLPDEVMSLLSLAEVRIVSRRLRIGSLRERKGVLEIEFTKIASINVEKLLRMIQTSAGKIKPDPARPHVIRMSTGSIGLKEKSEFIKDQLERLL